MWSNAKPIFDKDWICSNYLAIAIQYTGSLFKILRFIAFPGFFYYYSCKNSIKCSSKKNTTSNAYEHCTKTHNDRIISSKTRMREQILKCTSSPFFKALFLSDQIACKLTCFQNLLN